MELVLLPVGSVSNVDDLPHLANLEGLARASGLKQNGTEPRCICSLKIESLAEYTGLVPALRVGGFKQ
jgi:hypothetical protein